MFCVYLSVSEMVISLQITDKKGWGPMKASGTDNKSQISAVSRAVDRLHSVTRYPQNPPPSSSHLHPSRLHHTAVLTAPPNLSLQDGMFFWPTFHRCLSHSPSHLPPHLFLFSIFACSHHTSRHRAFIVLILFSTPLPVYPSSPVHRFISLSLP